LDGRNGGLALPGVRIRERKQERVSGERMSELPAGLSAAELAVATLISERKDRAHRITAREVTFMLGWALNETDRIKVKHIVSRLVGKHRLPITSIREGGYWWAESQADIEAGAYPIISQGIKMLVRGYGMLRSESAKRLRGEMVLPELERLQEEMARVRAEVQA